MDEATRRGLRTIGDLKRAGYRTRTVKDEMRSNLVARLREGSPLFPGIVGFDDTVIPQLVGAILGRHDFILLGLRGQAKSRLIRQLPALLDEFVPVIAGSDLNDDPFAPISKYGRDLVAAKGDAVEIDWLHRSARYGEKLATPDTSIADLIGDIDPIKAAHHRLTFADEEVIHFGIIPRTNRGIFAINEVPDLQPRIQVGLLNILEEQDIQIRGFNIRFPLDLLMVFSANPEDYTNRGAIITPLKDRIDSQIITHYPRTLETGIEITRREAWEERGGPVSVVVPFLLREVVEQIAFEARASEFVDQKSGVSARLTRAAMENLVSAAERRALLNGETRTVARPADLWFVEPAITGKVELVYEGEQEGAQAVARLLVGRAVKAIFGRRFPDPKRRRAKSTYAGLLQWFAAGSTVSLHHDMADAAYERALSAVPGLFDLVAAHAGDVGSEERPAMAELLLEALHQHSLLGKQAGTQGVRFADMMGSMLSGSETEDPEETGSWEEEP